MSEISEQAYTMYQQAWQISTSLGDDGKPLNRICFLWLEYQGEQASYKLFGGSRDQIVISSVSRQAWPIAHTHPFKGAPEPSLADREMIYVQALCAHGTTQVERPSYVLSGPDRSQMVTFYPTFEFGSVDLLALRKSSAMVSPLAVRAFEESGVDIDRYVLVHIVDSYYTFVIVNEDNSFGYHLVEDSAVAQEMKSTLWNRGNTIISFDEAQRRWVRRR